MSPFSSPTLPDDADVDVPEVPRRRSVGARAELAAHALAADVARLHSDALLRTARRYSLNADDAYDAYQRAFERLLEHAATIDRAKALAWMHVVVRREAGVVRRLQGPTTVPLEADDVDDALHRFASSPDERLHAIDLAQRAGEALATLKEAEAQALCLRAQGMSYDEIAETYGWTYSKVNRAVTEGRRAFADHYSAVESGVVCGDTAELVERYADGTLKPAVAVRVRAHLLRCSGCRRLLHAHRDADTALRALLPPAFVAVAAERTRGTGWLHDHLLGPIGHVAGRLQPAADQLVGSKLGLVAASTVALAGGGVAVERTVVQPSKAPAPLRAGLTNGQGTTASAPAAIPADAPIVRVVERAASNGEAAADRARQRAAAAAAAARRQAAAQKRRRVAARAKALAQRRANATEFAGGVAEFDTTTRASTARSGVSPSATTRRSAAGGTAAATGGSSDGSAPETEVPSGGGSDGSSIDVVTE